MFQKFLRGSELLECGTKLNSDLILMTGDNLSGKITENHITLYLNENFYNKRKVIYENECFNQNEVVYIQNLFSKGYSAFVKSNPDIIVVYTDEEPSLHFFYENKHTVKEFDTVQSAKNEYQKITGTSHLFHTIYMY